MRDLNTKCYTSDEIFRDIRDKIIIHCFNVDAAKITMDTNLIDDLSADVLDIVEVVISIEDEFDIDIPQSEGDNIDNCTIRHYVDIVSSALGDRFIRKENDYGRQDQSGVDDKEVRSP